MDAGGGMLRRDAGWRGPSTTAAHEVPPSPSAAGSAWGNPRREQTAAPSSSVPRCFVFTGYFL